MDIIVTHSNADFDALASLAAASKLYPNAKVIMPSSKERSVRDFLSMGNECVRAENEKNIDFKKMTRLIVVDTRMKNRIGKAGEFLNNTLLKLHCYDHHPRSKNDLKAHKDVYQKTGATVTILLEIIKRKKIAINSLEATIFALGIYEDTGSLTYQTTTKKDIDMVSYLFSKGANLRMIASGLNRELNKKEMHLISQLMEATKIFNVAGVNIAVASASIEDESMDLAWVTHKLIEIENFSVLFVLININGRIQMVARSRLSSVDANKITRVFNGGGHQSAASAIIREKRIADVESELLSVLKKKVKATLNAAEIMDVHFKKLNLKVTVQKAKQLMEKYFLNAVTVVEKNKFEGIITRNDIERALRQNYAHAPVKGYLRKSVPAVDVHVPVQDVQRIMSEKNLEIIPVLSKGNLIGIITRENILKGSYKDVFALGTKEKLNLEKKVTQKDFIKKLKRILPDKTLKLLREIGLIADEKGVKAYIIGGFVRDLILGRASADMDIVVEANAILFAQDLCEKLKAEVKVHHRFKTAKIKIQDGRMIDIATARTEFYETPAALPVIKSSSLSQDLYRRDFTINTLAVGLNESNFGKLIDYFNGEKDIREKRIRVLHDLSFVEDPTRIFRAVRFEQRFDFKIDKHTENLIKAAVDLEMFDKLHNFRIADELLLLLNEAHPVKVIRRMANLHELKFIHQKINFNRKMIKSLEAAEMILNGFKFNFLTAPIKAEIVYLLVILDGLKQDEIKEACTNFSFKRSIYECLFAASNNKNNVWRLINKKASFSPSSLYKMLKPLPVEVILFYMIKTKSIKKKEFYINFLKKYANIKLKISGYDLKKVVNLTGPRFKQALELTLFAKIDGKIKTEKQELEFASKIIENE